MKAIIKVKTFADGCLPKISDNGDWIDLYAAEDTLLRANQYQSPKKEEVRGEKEKKSVRNITLRTEYINLGVAMKLPDGYEAILASRSSTPAEKGLFIPSGIGVIDNTYSGNNDIWHFVASPMRNTIIAKGVRVAQFRIQLSQKATLWQKIKWLFTSGIEIQEVAELDNQDRGGLGSTGK